MKVYIAGPMVGYEDENRPLFAKVAEWLRAFLDWEVASPTEGDWQGQAPHEGDFSPWARAWYLKHDFALLLKQDAIVMLPGWRSSTGATSELIVAYACGMGAFEYVRGDGTALPVGQPPHLRDLPVHAADIDFDLLIEHVTDQSGNGAA